MVLNWLFSILEGLFVLQASGSAVKSWESSSSTICAIHIPQPNSIQGASLHLPIATLCPLKWVATNGIWNANSYASFSEMFPKTLSVEELGKAVLCAAVCPYGRKQLGYIFFSKDWNHFRWPFYSLCKYHPLDSKLKCSVLIHRKPGVFLIHFLQVEAMQHVLNVISNEQRLGGFIIIYKCFPASSSGILLLPAKSYLWKRSSTHSYCAISTMWSRHLLSTSATHCSLPEFTKDEKWANACVSSHSSLGGNFDPMFFCLSLHKQTRYN